MHLELRGITKAFGSLVANDGIDLTVEPGRIHALLGENGAGKSTLMNILFGLYEADAGEILLDGEPVRFHSAADAVAVVEDAMKDPHLAGLHVVSGLHPAWTFDDYLARLRALHERFPKLYLKGFTGVEITHFSKISGLSVHEVLQKLKAAGLDAIAGGGAEILSNRIREELCPNKATAKEWLDAARTAHELGIKSNASMLYGHIETLAERVDHLLALRSLQDETAGFQTFICFPFLPKNTALAAESGISQTSMWDDLRTMAISRLMLDNFTNIKAYWVMLTVPVAQVALGFGANDIDGTVHKETILHDAGAKSPRALTEDRIIRIVKEVGRIPAACDCNFNILHVYE